MHMHSGTIASAILALMGTWQRLQLFVSLAARDRFDGPATHYNYTVTELIEQLRLPLSAALRRSCRTRRSGRTAMAMRTIEIELPKPTLPLNQNFYFRQAAPVMPHRNK